jgi:excinuclease UvrABC ATPase subunit
MVYCDKNNIKVDDTFDSLSLEKKNLILYGESAEKLSFRFKHKGKNEAKKSVL